jgi:hypothetical protein
MPTLDEAIIFTLAQLRESETPEAVANRERDRLRSPGSTYGYDLYVPTLARKWAQGDQENPSHWDRHAREASGVFFEAAWELCRRGILRPGVRATSEQGINDGGGYCVTTRGREWLRDAADEVFVSVQPGALAAAFDRYRHRFGAGYHQRAQEAIRCRNSEAWVAACTMVGAAAESVMLALAIAKNGDEDAVLRAYMARDGRKGVMNILTNQASAGLTRQLTASLSLLSYWRDTAAHGQATPIGATEAEQSLRELLLLSQFASDNWDELVMRQTLRHSA